MESEKLAIHGRGDQRQDRRGEKETDHQGHEEAQQGAQQMAAQTGAVDVEKVGPRSRACWMQCRSAARKSQEMDEGKGSRRLPRPALERDFAPTPCQSRRPVLQSIVLPTRAEREESRCLWMH